MDRFATETPRPSYMDASVLVKLVVRENGSEAAREFVRLHSPVYASAVCLVEALCVLKRKWLDGQKAEPPADSLTTDQYHGAAYRLLGYFRNNGPLKIKDADLFTPSVFFGLESFSKRYNLDVADALQLFTLRRGPLSAFVGESKARLVTADHDLAAAAKAEGLLVWNCMTEPCPAPGSSS